MTINEIETTFVNLLPTSLGLMDASIEEHAGLLKVIIEGPDAPKQRMPLHHAGFYCMSKDQTRWESQLFDRGGRDMDRYTKALKAARWR